HHGSAASVSPEQRAAHGHEDRQPLAPAGLVGIDSSELNGKLDFTRVAIADEFFGPHVKVLLANPHAFAKGRRLGLVQDPNAISGATSYFDPVEARTAFACARTDRPHLSWWQGIAFDGLVAVQFRRRDELLDAVRPERVAKVRVAELALEHPLLLLLDPPTSFQRHPNDPL